MSSELARNAVCRLLSRWIVLAEFVRRARVFRMSFVLLFAHTSEPREGRRTLALGEALAEPWVTYLTNDLSPRRAMELPVGPAGGSYVPSVDPFGVLSRTSVLSPWFAALTMG